MAYLKSEKPVTTVQTLNNVDVTVYTSMYMLSPVVEEVPRSFTYIKVPIQHWEKVQVKAPKPCMKNPVMYYKKTVGTVLQ